MKECEMKPEIKFASILMATFAIGIWVIIAMSIGFGWVLVQYFEVHPTIQVGSATGYYFMVGFDALNLAVVIGILIFWAYRAVMVVYKDPEKLWGWFMVCKVKEKEDDDVFKLDD